MYCEYICEYIGIINIKVISRLLGSSTEPLGHLWSESKEVAVAVNISRDAFGSLGVRFLVPKCSLWRGRSTGGEHRAAREVRLALCSREHRQQREHRAQGPRAPDWKSTWCL